MKVVSICGKKSQLVGHMSAYSSDVFSWDSCTILQLRVLHAISASMESQCKWSGLGLAARTTPYFWALLCNAGSMQPSEFC